MKFSITKLAIPMFMFIANAQAYVTPSTDFGIPATPQECLQQGGSQAICDTLFHALAACRSNNSVSEEEWTNCKDRAEAVYLQSLAAGAPTGDEAYAGERLPVSTDSSDSMYEQRPEQKGFMNSDLE